VSTPLRSTRGFCVRARRAPRNSHSARRRRSARKDSSIRGGGTARRLVPRRRSGHRFSATRRSSRPAGVLGLATSTPPALAHAEDASSPRFSPIARKEFDEPSQVELFFTCSGDGAREVCPRNVRESRHSDQPSCQEALAWTSAPSLRLVPAYSPPPPPYSGCPAAKVRGGAIGPSVQLLAQVPPRAAAIGLEAAARRSWKGPRVDRPTRLPRPARDEPPLARRTPPDTSARAIRTPPPDRPRRPQQTTRVRPERDCSSTVARPRVTRHMHEQSAPPREKAAQSRL